MEFDLARATEVLRNTPGALRALLGGLSEPWIQQNYGPDTFSPFDVVGHLIHAERDAWMPRVRLILEHGAARPFEPFDRYGMYATSRGKTVADLLAEFAALRAASLESLGSLRLTDQQLNLCGRHPEFGDVTLRQLLATWVVHDLNHTHQICKAMAFQYRDQVGPWRAYIPFLPPE